MKELIDLLKTIFSERLVAWLALIAFAIPVAWVVYTFFVGGMQSSSQKYYDLKLEYCKEIAKSTAIIATSQDEKAIRAAAFRFDELYWGELVLVEDIGVEKAMVRFRDKMADLAGELQIDRLTARQIDRNELRSASLAVGHACFNSLQPSWLDMVFAFFRTQHKGK